MSAGEWQCEASAQCTTMMKRANSILVVSRKVIEKTPNVILPLKSVVKPLLEYIASALFASKYIVFVELHSKTELGTNCPQNCRCLALPCFTRFELC